MHISPLPRIIPPQNKDSSVWLYLIQGYYCWWCVLNYFSMATPEIKGQKEETGGERKRKGVKEWKRRPTQERGRTEKQNGRLYSASCDCTACSSPQRKGKSSGELLAVQPAGAALEVWRSLHAQNWWETVLCGCSHPWSRGWRGRVGGNGGPRDGRQHRVNQISPMTTVRTGEK